VKTLVVAAAGRPQVRTFPGRVDASRRAELAFQVPGLIVSLPIKEGQQIAAGEVIAQLRQEDFENPLNTIRGQLDQARAQLRALEAGDRPEVRLKRESEVRAAEARLANARIEYERSAQLLPSRAISQQNFDLAQTNYRVAQEDHRATLKRLEISTTAREEDLEAQQAEVRSLESRVVEAQLRLADATLRAPYTGVIARRLVEENQNVQAKQSIVQFQDIDELEIIVDVPETVMAADLQTAEFMELLAEFSGAPGLRFPVQIREMAKVADPATQTFQVRVALQAPEAVRILPGMTATVEMTYRRAEILGDSVMVPSTAIAQADDRQSNVWLLGSDQTVHQQIVTLGDAVGGDIEVLDGLSPGDRVVVAGVRFLREGMQVRDLGDSLAIAGAASPSTGTAPAGGESP
jgi:RND family efflux transporter MFP subunit